MHTSVVQMVVMTNILTCTMIANFLTIVDYYERNRDVSYIITAAIYLLNIVDASVDAHLFDFDISEDLSINCSPQL